MLSAMLERLGCSDMIGIVKGVEKKKSDYENVVKFSMSNKLWKKNPSIADLFACYFIDRCAEGHKKDKASDEWTLMDTKERKQITNKHFRTKKVAQIMLAFCGSLPKRNEGGEFRSAQLKVLSEIAHEQIREEIGLAEGKNVTQANLFASSLNEDFSEGALKKTVDVENI